MKNKIFSTILKAVEKGAFPGVRKWVWKFVYSAMSSSWSDKEWRFMNYGYIPSDPSSSFPLEEGDEMDRAFIGLYHQAVSGMNLEGLRVLEVGAGRGGGADYIARYFKPFEVIGVDFSQSTVRIAKKLNSNVSNLSFRHGDAEALPFDDNEFDVLLNIESSHCYGDVSAFVREAARVLKPGGIFSWADMRGTSMMSALEEDFKHDAFELIEQRSLSEGVVPALDAMSERKASRIRKIPVFRRFMSEFAATKGTTLYNGIKAGRVLYLSRRYQKRSA